MIRGIIIVLGKIIKPESDVRSKPRVRPHTRTHTHTLAHAHAGLEQQ